MTGKWVEWELRAGVLGRFEGREGGGQGRGLGFWAIFRIFCEFPESPFSGKRYNKRHRFSLRRGVFWRGALQEASLLWLGRRGSFDAGVTTSDTRGWGRRGVQVGR